MAHVFISYVHQNRDVVDRLAKELRNRGVTVWLDRDDIEPGARWRDAIKKAIQTGKFFVACFSREYSERNQTHMNEELTLAIDELRARPSEKTWFLPVLINETHIPSRRISSVEDLRDIQAVKLHEDWDMGINRILRVLQQDDPALARIWHLVHIVEGPFDDERLYSIQQLGAIRATEKSAISALIKAAEANKSAIRQASLEALGRIGPAAAEAAVPALAAGLKDPDLNVRHEAALAVVRIGPAAAGAVPALAAALKDPKESVRRTAAVALAEIGPAAAGAVPALVAALKDPDKNFRWHVTGALWKIGPGAVPALVAALKDPDENIRWPKIGPGAVPALVTVNEDDDTVRQHFVSALGMIGPAAAEAVPALVAALKDPNKPVRRDAAAALANIGPAAAGAVPDLIAALKDPDEIVRQRVADALGRVQGKSAP